MKPKEHVGTNTIQKIVQLIKDEKLKPGDKLPAERKLSSQLGISRASLREALNHLKAKGVVRIRQGSGVYIDSIEEINHKESSKDPFEQLYELLETRKMIETFATIQLAAVINREQVQQLYDVAVEEHNRVLYNQGCPEIAKSPHLSFESLIVALVGNSFISRTHKQLSIRWKSILDEMNAIVMEACNRHEQHLEIVNALAQKDARLAVKLLNEHHISSEKAIDNLVIAYQESKKILA